MVSQLYVFELLSTLILVVAVKLFKCVKVDFLLFKRAPIRQHFWRLLIKLLFE